MSKDEPPDRMKELDDPHITFIRGDPTNRLDLDKCFVQVASMHAFIHMYRVEGKERKKKKEGEEGRTQRRGIKKDPAYMLFLLPTTMARGRLLLIFYEHSILLLNCY